MSGTRSQCAAEVHARVLPVVVVVGAGEDLERPLLVGRHQGELGLAGADGHALEPVGEARGALVERGLHVGRRGQGGLRVVGRVPEGPGEEAQLERAAVADAALVGVGAAHVRHHGGEALGAQRGHGGLRPAGPRGAEGAHRAVAPLLLADPGEGVGAVLGLGDQEVHVALGAEAAAAVLVHHHVAARGEVPALARGGLGLHLVVGRAVQEDGAAVGQRAAVAGRAVDVGRQADAVAHGDHDVLGEVHVELRAGRRGRRGRGASCGRWLLWARRALSGDAVAASGVESATGLREPSRACIAIDPD